MASGRVPMTNAIRYWRSFPPGFGAANVPDREPRDKRASGDAKMLDKAGGRIIRCVGGDEPWPERPSIDGILVAQVTDLHIGFDRDNPHELNVRRLNMVIDQLNAMRPKPSLLLVTGDLVENGDDVDAYRHMVALVGRWEGPVLWAIGNHDGREHVPGHAAATCRPTRMASSNMRSTMAGVRWIVLDTLDPGRHGGHDLRAARRVAQGAAGRAHRRPDDHRPPPPAGRHRASTG